MCFHKDHGGAAAAERASEIFDKIVQDLSSLPPVPVHLLLRASDDSEERGATVFQS